MLHVAEVFAFCHRSLAESFVLNGLEKVLFPMWLYAGPNEISHKGWTPDACWGDAEAMSLVSRPTNSNKHLVLGQRATLPAATAISRPAPGEEKLQPNGDALH